MTTTFARPQCFYVPPYVESALVESAAAPSVDQAQADLSGEARDRRAGRLSELAEKAEAAEETGMPVELAPPATGTARREVFDSGNTTNQRVTLVRPEGGPETKDADVINAYDNAGLVRSYFRETLNRNSIDNRALDLVLNVHYGTSYNNAFWDGDEMTFGDGDGVIFSGFARSLDVVAHELAHGVTQFASGLVYQGESGALNEHFSDAFGTAITQWAAGERPEDADWLIGDEIMGPELYGEALRSMRYPGTAYDNPILGKDPQPAHYADRYTGNADNGGVHINSGIPNRAFYRVATELGDTLVAARIWYHALNFLRPRATFAQAAAQTAESARILVKSGAVHKGATQVVRGAWHEVGVG
ncbi:peptidase M4 family protein [Nocardioides sp. GY 10113]|uniref:M4 family metallopeptidase n=1 Tax=Nocardioides sp. GY 10113 TaxID=2569761 RepID=UPI0010A79549|nr:M4 family metallopeptidase [Nocardioides sp. GY 10113]TIC87702.1 peptidase M4 family protein [Nocardioides sp. GY 10113]